MSLASIGLNLTHAYVMFALTVRKAAETPGVRLEQMGSLVRDGNWDGNGNEAEMCPFAAQ